MTEEAAVAADDLDTLRQWVGKSATATDTIAPYPIAALAATLDLDPPDLSEGAAIPQPWHWLYFLEPTRASKLGHDGHAQRGGLLPPVALPRRMWAGGHITFHRPLRIGQQVQRTSTVTSVDAKQGRTGSLVFVAVTHEVHGPAGIAVEERHDIVYRDAPTAPAAAEPPREPRPGEAASAVHDWHRKVNADAVMLFRYSALTFNGHRIHYDRPYVTEEEGYPGLVVHGPLQATLLLDLVRQNKPDLRLRAFDYRARAPVFDTAPVAVNGRMLADGSARLWTATPDGRIAMEGSARLEDM